MKKVSFDLEVEVHNDLESEILKDYISHYFINQESFDDFRLKIIGEKGSPNNFEIGSIKFDLKKKKAKAKKKAKK